MSIMIDRDKCVGCGRCTGVCPGDLIRLRDKKALIDCPKECWGCSSCVKACPLGAICLYLGADIGGLGHTLFARDKGDELDWIFEDKNGESTVITVNKRDANKY